MTSANKIDYILQHITSLLSRDSDQFLLEQLGIGYSQYKILRSLDQEAPVKQRFIADTLGQTEASISRQVDLLIDKDLIVKKIDARNRRVRLITITPKGMKITHAADDVLDRYHRSLFSEVDSKQQNDLLESLENLHRKICAIDHSYATYRITHSPEN